MTPKKTPPKHTQEDPQQETGLAPVDGSEAQRMLSFRDYINQDDVVNRFANLIGSRQARFFVGSVITTVSFRPELLECTFSSIAKSAFRAATLELSCDESLKQAQLVPYWNNKSNKRECKFIPHYMGIIHLAQRTGKYQVINYGAVHQGMEVDEDMLTGMHTITGRRDRKQPIKGYFAYYKMTNGFERSAYMTLDEIAEHASKFAPSYNTPGSNWNVAKLRPYMEQKTVIRQLMSTADLSGRAGQALAMALSDDIDDADREWEDAAAATITIIDAKAAAEQPPIAAPIDPRDLTPEDLERPVSTETLRSQLIAAAKARPIEMGDDKEKDNLGALLEEIFAPAVDAKERANLVVTRVWGYPIRKLTIPQVRTMMAHLNPQQDAGGLMVPDPISAQELRNIYAEIAGREG